MKFLFSLNFYHVFRINPIELRYSAKFSTYSIFIKYYGIFGFASDNGLKLAFTLAKKSVEVELTSPELVNKLLQDPKIPNVFIN